MQSRVSKSTFKILVLAALLIMGISLCYFLSPQTPEISHVLLISIDTCRADHLGCYGYPLNTTPHIDAIAKKGIVFENAFSPQPFTLPAHCSMLTGTIPPFHGVLDNSDYKLSEDNTTLAQLLKRKGFSTAGFVSSFVLDACFGLNKGFDLYDDDFADTSNTMGINQCTGDEISQEAIEWLDTHKHENNFMFLHYYDPHFTYAPPEPFASKFKNVPRPEHMSLPFKQVFLDGYTNEIAYTDHCIGQVINKLKQLGLYDSTLIIITSDHGEMLGQHGEASHGYFIYQPAIKVPLIVKTPGRTKSLRITHSVGIADIVPTVCALLNIEIPTPVQGQDLSPCFKGETLPSPDQPLFCQSLESTKYNANSLLGVVTDQYKYIRTTRPELYDLVKDPYELNNMAARQPDQLQAMEDTLQQILADASQRKASAKAGLDEATRRRLESLGYVGGTIKEDFDVNTGGDDPKDLIEYHVRTMRVGYLIHNKEYASAESLIQALSEERPLSYRPYFNLGKLAVTQERYAEAIVHLQKVVELKPDHVDAYEGLGKAYEALGQFDKAVLGYAKTLEFKPDTVEVYYRLALCFFELGDYRGLAPYTTRDIMKNPSFAKAALSLADKLLEKQQIRLAYEQYARLLELETESVTLLNSLAWIEAACDIEGLVNPDLAVTRALKACELTHYETAEVIDTLAVAYAGAGKFSDAQKTAQKAISMAQSEGNTALAQRIRKRLTLYQADKPYRDAALARDAGQ